MAKRIFCLLQILLLVSICLSLAGCVDKEAPTPQASLTPKRQKDLLEEFYQSHPREAYEIRDSPTGQSEVISTDAVILAESRIVAPGDRVQVPIRLENAPSTGAMNFTITYDPSVLKVTGVEKGSLLSGVMFSPNYREPPAIYFGFATTGGINGTGSLAYIEFEVIGSKSERSFLTFSDLLPKDTSGREILMSVQNGVVSVEQERLPGDYNCDGRVTELDALTALRMSAHLLEEDLILDMDADGSVTADDARKILARSIQTRSPLSPEQEQIISEFGRPDSFIIMEIDNSEGQPIRYEYWTYFDGEITYVFADGVFQTWQEAACPQGDVIAAPYRPDEFAIGVSIDELECLTTGNEWLRMETTDFLLEGIVEGIEVYINQQVAAGFYDDRLFYVEAMAIELEGGN